VNGALRAREMKNLFLQEGLVILKPMRFCFAFMVSFAALAAPHPNVVLVMADDQGWGQMGYYNHPKS